MAFEIRELVIRAVVDPAAGGGGAKAPRTAGAAAPALSAETIVTECVEQVLDILRRREER